MISDQSLLLSTIVLNDSVLAYKTDKIKIRTTQLKIAVNTDLYNYYSYTANYLVHSYIFRILLYSQLAIRSIHSKLNMENAVAYNIAIILYSGLAI